MSSKFIGRDDKTQGRWFGVYGKRATALPNSVAEGTELAFPNPLPEHTFSSYTRDDRAPMASALLPNRAARAWYAPSLTLTVTPDAPLHVSLYLVDWHREGLKTQVELRQSGETPTDVQILEKFDEGSFLSWLVDRPTVFRLTGDTQHVPLFGVFLDQQLRR